MRSQSTGLGCVFARVAAMCLVSLITVMVAGCDGEAGEPMSAAQCQGLGGGLVDGECHVAVTDEECTELGGNLVGDDCQMPMPPEEMKKICDAMGQAYSEKYNGCIQD